MTEQREQSFACSLNTKPSFFGGFFVFHEFLLLRPFETFLFQWNKVKGGVLFIFEKKCSKCCRCKLSLCCSYSHHHNGEKYVLITLQRIFSRF